MKYLNKFVVLLSLLPILLVYYRLFLSGGVGGDTVFIFPTMFKDFSLLPFAWSWTPNNGFGGFISPFTASQFLTAGIHFLGSTISLPWSYVFAFIFVVPFLVCGYVCSLIVARFLFPQKIWTFFVPVIFLLNTYVLMLTGGGQMVVALAYTLIPLVWYLFYKVLTKQSAFLVALCSFVLGIQLMLDLRITYITLFSVVLFFLFAVLTKIISLTRELVIKKSVSFLAIAIVTTLLQSFWLLPTILKHDSPLSSLGSAYTSREAVTYFSFATFENTISLLHPNWPENIFGKTYFMRPEFLLLAILAFSSLLFIRRDTKKRSNLVILYLALLSLIAAFLAKGANEPFGSLYVFFFDHLPGFVMFRDSSKWYSLIAFSYSILIPFSLANIYQIVAKKHTLSRLLLHAGFIVVCTGITYLLLFPALLGRLGGTFHASRVPEEYSKLEKKLSSDKTFSRVLWLPTTQRYGYSSQIHPAVVASDFFQTSSSAQLISDLRDPHNLKRLQEASIRYIVVPYDSEKEIYLNDRKYDPAIQQRLLSEIATVKGVQKDSNFCQIGVFSLTGAKRLFWSPDANLRISSQSLSPVSSELTLSNAKKGDIIVFSQTFDPSWELEDRNTVLTSSPYLRPYNSFVLQRGGNYTVTLSYSIQRYTNIGTIISAGAVCCLLLYLVISFQKEKNS